jgi:hypothetical protein
MKRSPADRDTKAFEDALAAVPNAAHYRLRLFVGGSTPRSLRAIRNIRALCEDIDPIEIDINRAAPCALILNELLTNAFKYAFSDRREGKIRVPSVNLILDSYS